MKIVFLLNICLALDNTMQMSKEYENHLYFDNLFEFRDSSVNYYLRDILFI